MPRQYTDQSLPPRDVELSFHGSINLLKPITEAAQDWIDENVAEGDQFFGRALAVEPRYTDDIVKGMIDDGLVVYVGDGYSPEHYPLTNHARLLSSS